MTDRSYQSELTIPPSCAGKRIDVALAMLLSDVSRTTLKKWIQDGSVEVDGKSAKPSSKVTGGEHVVISGLLPQPMDWDSQQQIEFKVVFETAEFLVVEKPAGVVVHPGTGNPDGTLVNGLIAHRSDLVDLPRAGIVHRLDKDTSGLLVVAATRTASEFFTAALARREVRRVYSCVVEGVLEAAQHVEAPIGRDPQNRTRQTVRDGGRSAITTFSPIELFRGHTLAEATIETGRTHQIRVHAQWLGLPIVGDQTYGARGKLPKTPSEDLIVAIREFNRQALHASVLEFEHPRTGERMNFRSELPPDVQSLVQALRDDQLFLLDS